MHVDHELVEFVSVDEQDYEEVIEEYEEEICWHKMWRTVPHTQQAEKRSFNRVLGCFVIRKHASQFDLKTNKG